MCGRYVQRSPLQNVIDLFSAIPEDSTFTLKPRYNIAPSQDVPAIRVDDHGQRQICLLRWGLIPPWAESPAIGNRMINARSEEIATKRAYRNAFKHRRCILPADGFYEWKVEASSKQPYYIHQKDNQPFGIAGIWESWGEGENKIESCAILTTEPNEVLRPIHDRMPVILKAEDYQTWLDQSQPIDVVQSLTRCRADLELVAHPVATHVNNPRYEHEDCIEPAGPGFPSSLWG